MNLDHLRHAMGDWHAAGGSRHELSRRTGIRTWILWGIAHSRRGCSSKLAACIEGALSTRPGRRRPGRLPAATLDELWRDLEDRSPTWRQSMAALRRAQVESRRFAQLPREQRQRAVSAKPMKKAWWAYHGADRPKSVYAVIRREAGGAFERGEREMGKRSDEATNLARTPRRRLRQQAQLEGLVPDVIYRDSNEKSWRPTREKLRMRMIDRAEFDALPARLPLARFPKAVLSEARVPRGGGRDERPRTGRYVAIRAIRAFESAMSRYSGRRPGAGLTL